MRKQSLWRAQFNGNKDMELSYIFFEEAKLVLKRSTLPGFKSIPPNQPK
jgi:hypothetical protein